ncbi:DUF1415 domain-containing protein [Deminuibacter soli]|uniref:DUF1415 domain-containing protein n=1 Tax=Deminuibacter soli TaxID=2291815 RepID=A0A3E1NI70_9BACT|nr:DUF1415 domain-containing protein [Deminuibacter soli]RFM27635.1 DUF1415 domain-containing protein [Deminuibacter soli]
MEGNEQVIIQTKKWITEVVVGCNFCPFAARELRLDTIRYAVEPATAMQACVRAFVRECEKLDADASIATTLVIFPQAFTSFNQFLKLVREAERMLKIKRYTGIYQVATFHPDYRFAGTTADDAANYTNRSIYPMLHILRESSVEKALKHYAEPEKIPERNIRYAHEKGLAYMQQLRNDCL